MKQLKTPKMIFTPYPPSALGMVAKPWHMWGVPQRLLAVLFLFLALAAAGQTADSTKTPHAWKFMLGYEHFRTLDNNVSPLIYAANNAVLGVRFQKENTQRPWSIEAAVGVGNNQSVRFGQRELVVYDAYSVDGERDSSVYTINPALSFVRASLAYSSHWAVGTAKVCRVGGTVYNHFLYGGLGGDVWFFNQLSLSPSFQIDVLKRGTQRLTAELSTPLVSYNVRQPYTLDPSLPEANNFMANLKTGSKVATLNTFQQVQFSLDFSHQLNNDLRLGLLYQFMWMNYSNIPSRNLHAYSNSIAITYTL